MTPNEAKKVLRRAFKALTADQRKNLRAHARAGTRICCGDESYVWVYEGKG
jgi:hypothetical protein